MGKPKMLLPWGKLTVIEHVITIFLEAGIEDILVITGGAHKQVERATEMYPVRRIYNEKYQSGEMLSSLQYGLRAMNNQVEATLVGLGDQPQVQERSVHLIIEAYELSKSPLIVPSFGRRRGHPWLVARPLWGELLSMKSPETPRDFLNKHSAEIHYVDMDTASILADLDTPEDYERFHPQG